MPRIGWPRVWFWRGAAGCALIALAAVVAALAYAGSQARVVALPRVIPTTRVVTFHGRKTLTVVDLELARVPAGVRVRIACKGCQRLAGETTRTARSLRGVNWLLTPGRTIRIALARHGALGRVLVLVADRPRRRLVVRATACLDSAGRSVRCPAGVRNPRPGTPATEVAPGGPPTTTPTVPPGTVTFSATFDTGEAAPLSAQCAPTTPSKSPRYRGTYAIESSVVGQGTGALEITLPRDPDPTTFPLEACDLTTPPRPIALGTESYFGLMVYVPVGWTIPGGVNIYELHFQNVYGAPVTLNLHPDHVTLELDTGACSNHTTASPGCTNRSNADIPPNPNLNLPRYYAVPPGALVDGGWNEIVVHVVWSSTNTGQIQTYYRVKGQTAWRQSSNIAGIPTVQWDRTRGCCAASYVDELEAYTFAYDTPLSVWFDNIVDGTSLAAVEASMP